MKTRDLFDKHGLPVEIVSGGSSGTFDIDVELPGLTELQSGSYCVMDIDYRRIGAKGSKINTQFELALTVLTTVVSRPSAELAIVDGGFKAFSTDRPFVPEAVEWPGVEYSWAGDEHGRLTISDQDRAPRLGDRIEFFPPHCDPTINLYDQIYAMRGDKVEAVWEVSGRGQGPVARRAGLHYRRRGPRHPRQHRRPGGILLERPAGSHAHAEAARRARGGGVAHGGRFSQHHLAHPREPGDGRGSPHPRHRGQPYPRARERARPGSHRRSRVRCRRHPPRAHPPRSSPCRRARHCGRRLALHPWVGVAGLEPAVLQGPARVRDTDRAASMEGAGRARLSAGSSG